MTVVKKWITAAQLLLVVVITACTIAAGVATIAILAGLGARSASAQLVDMTPTPDDGLPELVRVLVTAASCSPSRRILRDQYLYGGRLPAVPVWRYAPPFGELAPEAHHAQCFPRALDCVRGNETCNAFEQSRLRVRISYALTCYRPTDDMIEVILDAGELASVYGVLVREPGVQLLCTAHDNSGRVLAQYLLGGCNAAPGVLSCALGADTTLRVVLDRIGYPVAPMIEQTADGMLLWLPGPNNP